MKMSLCQVIAFFCILAVGIILGAPIQETEANRYATRYWERLTSIHHNNGDITEHVVQSDTTYSIDHNTRTNFYSEGGSLHWHNSPEYSCNYSYIGPCYLNSTCSLCD